MKLAGLEQASRLASQSVVSVPPRPSTAEVSNVARAILGAGNNCIVVIDEDGIAEHKWVLPNGLLSDTPVCGAPRSARISAGVFARAGLLTANQPTKRKPDSHLGAVADDAA